MKRDPEHLDALVADTLRRVGPVSAYSLSSSLREQGHSLTETQAYRVLRRLIARGDVRQIWLGRRYMMRQRSDPLAIALVCRTCGRIIFTPAGQAHEVLSKTAAGLGFKVEDVIIEMAGLCSGCESAVNSDGRMHGEDA